MERDVVDPLSKIRRKITTFSRSSRGIRRGVAESRVLAADSSSGEHVHDACDARHRAGGPNVSRALRARTLLESLRDIFRPSVPGIIIDRGPTNF